MKKIIALMLATVMATSLVACSTTNEADEDADTSLQYVLDNGKLVMGLDDTFVPMGFRDDDQNIVGFDVDVAYAVAEVMGVELELQPIAWSAKENELNTKRIDVIWNGFSISDERLEQVTFTDAYMNNEMAFVVKSGSGITSLDELAGLSLGIQGGSSAETALTASDVNDTLAEVVPYDTNQVALLALDTDSVDVVLMDSVSANYAIVTEGMDFVLLEETLDPEQYAVGCRLGEEALANAINEAFSTLKADGTLAEISTKWFGSDVTTIE